MRERYRLNLEAPFTRAAHNALYQTADETQRRHDDPSASVSMQTAVEQENEPRLKRVPVGQRGQSDFKGDAMVRYIANVEARTIAHFSKHAPRWLNKETDKIMQRWSAPQPKLTPQWAPAIDRQTEARDYAAALLRERLRTRIHRIADIRIARTLGGYGQVDPLNLIFHDRSTVFREPKNSKIKIRNK